MAIRPADVDVEVENQEYAALIDSLFPANAHFAYQMKSGTASAFFRDEPLSNAFLNLLDLLDARDASVIETLGDLDNKVDKEDGKGLSSNDFTNALKTKLESLSQIIIDDALSSDSTNPVQNKIIKGALDDKLSKTDVIKVANIDNNKTNDNAPFSAAAVMELIGDIDYSSFLTASDVQSSLTGIATLPPSVQAVVTALAGKVDSESGKGLYPDTDKQKVAALESTYIKLEDERNSLTAVSPETQATTDTKVPTVAAVRAALASNTTTVDNDFSTTSENPLQNKVITNRIQSETAASYTNFKLPTIGVVSSMIAAAIETALSSYQSTDEKMKVTRITSDTNQTIPVLFGSFSANQTSEVTGTGRYNNDVNFNAYTGEFSVPFLTQTQGGNYYITSGTETPSNNMQRPIQGMHELYIQYD